MSHTDRDDLVSADPSPARARPCGVAPPPNTAPAAAAPDADRALPARRLAAVRPRSRLGAAGLDDRADLEPKLPCRRPNCLSQPRSRRSPGGLFPELRPRMHRVHRDRALAPPVAMRRTDRRRPQRYVETVLGSRHAAMERDHAPHAPEELALRARNET